jgi:enoyl-CoA hydratase/carnithine racemase
MDLLMTGRVIEAAEAERFGIIQRLWPAADWDRELEAFVQELAVGPTKVYAAWKASVNRAVLMELDAYTDHENLLNAALAGSTDTEEGVASFRERRSPVFTGS